MREELNANSPLIAQQNHSDTETAKFILLRLLKQFWNKNNF